MVESGTTEIALSRLIQLADAYGVLVTELLVDVHERQVELTSRREQYRFPSGVEGVEVRYLTSPSWAIQPFQITLQPKARLDSLRHAGEEFIHCQEGQVLLRAADRDHRLRSGDTIYIPGGVQHSYLNPSRRVTHLVGGTLRRSQSNLPPGDDRQGRS